MRLLLLLSAMLLIGAPSVFAHSKLISATPSSGTIVPDAPEEIVLEFGEQVRVTSVVVESPNSGRQKLRFAPKKKAAKFTVATTGLPAGRHEIIWKALSADGHAVSGSVILVVRPEEKARSASRAE
jgi:methionine-rich copper-binding protein CopC